MAAENVRSEGVSFLIVTINNAGTRCEPLLQVKLAATILMYGLARILHHWQQQIAFFVLKSRLGFMMEYAVASVHPSIETSSPMATMNKLTLPNLALDISSGSERL